MAGVLDPIKPEGTYDTVYHPNRIWSPRIIQEMIS